MAYAVKILADSVNPVGDRITTFELSYPRFVHAELMTHRLFSRNSASSRAIPTDKLIKRIMTDPVLPKWWGKNQSGMQARSEMEGAALDAAREEWLVARNHAVRACRHLHALGLHKQIANRIIEPWMFITVIVTATEYDNWFYLRDSEYAQPEIAWVARQMRIQYDENVPERLEVGRWHLPLVSPPWHQDHDHPLHVSWADVDRLLEAGQEPISVLVKISAARCARVSYLTHDGVRDLEDDLRLHDKLSGNGHWSPFEHPARCLGSHERVGNFVGWRQYRKFFPDEHHGKAMP